MRIDRNARARHFAEELVNAWLDGKPVDDILSRCPSHLERSARSIARGTCEMIVGNAKRREKGLLYCKRIDHLIDRYKKKQN